MMVVMLIMSIILAAMAPVMTTRSKADSTSPWRYSPENLSDAYFGAGDSQIAMIGQPNKLETDDTARLILNTNTSLPYHISFKSGNTTLGRLFLKDSNIILGNSYMNIANNTGTNNIAIGTKTLEMNTTGSNNISLGHGALSNNSVGNDNIAIGTNASTKSNNSANIVLGKNAFQSGNGDNNVIIGSEALANKNGSSNIVIGANAMPNGGGNNNIAIGVNANSYSSDSIVDTIAIGNNTSAIGGIAIGINSAANGGISLGSGSHSDTNAIAIGGASSAEEGIAMGHSAVANEYHSISIGNEANSYSGKTIAVGSGVDIKVFRATGAIAIGEEASIETDDSEGAIALGLWARSGFSDTIAIGREAHSLGKRSIAIGNNANNGSSKINNKNYDSIAIGTSAIASELNSIAIGSNANAANSNNIAIGYQACRGVSGNNKICIGANSGQTGFPAGWASDNQERIYIGSRSKFNNGTAVLEVHNVDTNFSINGGGSTYSLNGSGVVINGSLIVKGPLISAGVSRGQSWTNADSPGYYSTFEEHPGDGDFPDVVGSYSGGTAGNAWRSHPIFSDLHLKYIGKESTNGLKKIKQLKVFNYTFKKDETKTPHVGVIAQDLQKVFPDAVKKGKDGFLTIRFEDMFFAMINAIKELDLKYEAQEKRINELETQLKNQNIRLEKLEAKLK